MGITPVRCPACAAAFTPGRALEPGQRMQCPHCAAVVTVPAAADPTRTEERPRKRRKKPKTKRTRPVLLWGLVGGAAAVVLGIVVLVLVLSGKTGGGENPLLAGEWEPAEGNRKYVLEFTRGGQVRLRGDFAAVTDFRFAKPLKVFTDFGLQPGTNLDITYRFVSATRLEVRANYLPLLEKLSAGAQKEPPAAVVAESTPTEILTYAVTEKELTLTNDQGKSLRLRRG